MSPEAHILGLLEFGSFTPDDHHLLFKAVFTLKLSWCSNIQGLGELVTFQVVKVQEVSPFMAMNKLYLDLINANIPFYSRRTEVSLIGPDLAIAKEICTTVPSWIL